MNLRDQVRMEAQAIIDRRFGLSPMMSLQAYDLDRPKPRPSIREGHDPRPHAASKGPCPRCAVRGDLGCAHQQPWQE